MRIIDKIGLVILVAGIMTLGCHHGTTSRNNRNRGPWTSQLGTYTGDYASAVATDTSGNIYVAGLTKDDLDGHTNAGSGDLFVVKYNSAGVKQ